MVDSMDVKPVIFGCSGLSLTKDEKELFGEYNPMGLILFARNIDTPEQVSSLVKDFKSTVSHDHPLVTIDQEGGVVSRLKPPHWDLYINNCAIGDLAQSDMAIASRIAYLKGVLIGNDLKKLGINGDFAPVADVMHPNTASFLAKRSFGGDAKIVRDLCAEFSEGLLAMGVFSTAKHAPGHGVVSVDTHTTKAYSDVSYDDLTSCDASVFAGLKGLPMWMVAHVIYNCLDSKNPATSSKAVIQYLRNALEYDGIIITDSIDMSAAGDNPMEAAMKCMDAGVDLVAQCSGNMGVMKKIAGAIHNASSSCVEKVTHLLESLSSISMLTDIDMLREEYNTLVADHISATD